MSRTQKQYNEFRRAFKAWCKKYRPLADKAWATQTGIELRSKGKLVADYHAPDYVKYMKYTLRGLGK